ncbi:F-box only protein 28 isoform X2 [Anabrus simplex]|uniref:F-box only protein 28 isoform X2 n=1 Tax=Anabrus simplex TaxID=316456 RepID=UPI0034DD8668
MLHLLSLPDIVLEKILSYLCYDDIAKQRLICRQFDAMCKQLLNKGFISAEKYHSQCLKSVKSQLPRRESERRSHPMARHCDILTAIETRISMLSMTFMKYVDVGMCCFIPGKVIDEIFRVLRLLKVSKTPPRAHEILQELRDISSMAMEHFDEKIVPGLKHKVAMTRVSSSLSPSGSSFVAGSSHGSPMLTQERIRVHFHKLQSRTKRNKSVLDKLVLKVKRQNFQLSLQGSKLRDQGSKLHDLALKLSEKDTQIAELKRHVEELDHKFGDLAAELSRAREEKGALAESPSMTCGNKRKFFSPILGDHLDEKTKKFKSSPECPVVTEETHD